MQAMSTEALPLTATPTELIQKWATTLTLIYARAPMLKYSGIGRKEGRKSLFGKVYINWWYLQYNNFSLGDHTKTAVRSLS